MLQMLAADGNAGGSAVTEASAFGKELKERAVVQTQCFAQAHAPEAAVVLLAGSRVRGTATERSDFDVVLLFGRLSAGAWREMVRWEGQDFEVFAHDPETLLYFFEEVERPSGKPALLRMVMEGEAVVGRDAGLLAAAKRMAERAFEAGPMPLTPGGAEMRRYAITDVAEALRGREFGPEWVALGATLYGALVEFVLLANGRWTASGKAVPAALRAFDPEVEREFFEAFAALFGGGGAERVQALVDAVLGPFGGRCRAGFRQVAPVAWRKVV